MKMIKKIKIYLLYIFMGAHVSVFLKGRWDPTLSSATNSKIRNYRVWQKKNRTNLKI